MTPPENPKIYHIIHVDRLSSVLADGELLCDAAMAAKPSAGTVIGMNDIKQRRLSDLRLTCHPHLLVGQCVPFYFCPRSVMLYIIHKANHPSLSYRGGQEPIVHIEADLRRTVAWAEARSLRWAFTLSNAGSRYFKDRCRLSQLSEINWAAVSATQWKGELEEGKQAEFLVEGAFPWSLVERIGVCSTGIQSRVTDVLTGASHQPPAEVRPDWYY